MNKLLEYLRKKRWWRSLAVVVIVVIAFLIYLRSENYCWLPFTGFEGKTVWDVLGLLIIPASLAMGAHKLTLGNQREMILQNYFDTMSRLLLDKNLKGSKPHNEVREIARVKTCTTLKRMNGDRMGALVGFLGEIHLIQKINGNNPIISLGMADLMGAHLKGADLRGADLEFAYLKGADLRGAHLEGAYLKNAYMKGADLRGAHLEGADLSGAHLEGAHLEGADLSGAHLKSADLGSAYLKFADLGGTYLKGAIMPDSQMYNPAIHTIEKLTEEEFRIVEGKSD